MPGTAAFGLFLTAAIILAITPGPGIFYVLTRSISGGRRAGIASSLGTAVGGLGHVWRPRWGFRQCWRPRHLRLVLSNSWAQHT